MIPERSSLSLLLAGGERTEEAPEPEPDILTAITTALVLCRGNTHTHTQMRSPPSTRGR